MRRFRTARALKSLVTVTALAFVNFGASENVPFTHPETPSANASEVGTGPLLPASTQPDDQVTLNVFPANPADDVRVVAVLNVTRHALDAPLPEVAFGFEYPGVGETLHDVRWVRNFGDDWVVFSGVWRSIMPDEFVSGILNSTDEPRIHVTLQSFHQGLTGEPRSLLNDGLEHHGTVRIDDLILGTTIFDGVILAGDMLMESFTRRGPWVDAAFAFKATAFDPVTGNLNRDVTVTIRLAIVDAVEMR